MLVLDDYQKEVLKVQGDMLLASGRQVGKSTIVSIRAAEELAKARNKILIISHTEKQAELLFFKVLHYLQEKYPKLIKQGKERPTRHIINLINGSVLYCYACGETGAGLLGFTLNGVIIDEAELMPQGIWAVVTPMLLTTGGWIWLLGTPKGAKGFFYDCYKNEDGRFKVFHVNSEDVIRNRPVSVTWTQYQKDSAISHLEKEKKRMSAREYAQTYMGEFIKELHQFFPDEVIEKCMTRRRNSDYKISKDMFLGVDVARLGDDECVFSIIDRANRNRLIHVENIIWKKHRLNEVYNKIIELDNQYKFKAIFIDDGGIGVGVFDYLLENPKTSSKVIAINNRSRPLDRDAKDKKKLLKEDLYNNLLGLMERGEIELLQDDELRASFASVQYEYVIKRDEATALRIFGDYTHIVEALIRAAWCVKDKHLNFWFR